MRTVLLLPLFGLSVLACDGRFSSPNGHPVPIDRDARDATNTPDTTTDTSSPSDTTRPGPNDASSPRDTTSGPAPSDTAQPSDTSHPNDTSAPHDTSTPHDTNSPDAGPDACNDPNYFACTASDDLEYCDGGTTQVANCGAVCHDAGYAYTTGCGFDDQYGGDVCWCDNVEAPAPTCNANACANSCYARGYAPGGCNNDLCSCGAPLPTGPSCNEGWSCEGETLAYCDGETTERWNCDDFCQGEGYAFASGCGYDASVSGDACLCEDDACTGGHDICLGSDYLETCTGSGAGTATTVDCWDVCQDAGYDSVAGCGADGSGGDACFCQNEVCGSNELTCADGRCLDTRYVCDGVVDCSSGDDEWGCAPTCVEGDSVCLSSYELEVCDGGEPLVYDCDDFCRSEGFDFADGCGYDGGSGYDSCYCAYEACASWEFQCDDGLCLDEVYTCDGILDCSYGEDEVGCF